MKNFKIILSIFAFSFFSVNTEAQVGIGTTIPDGALDITSADDGLLIPRVALTITTSALPLTTPTISELVYNTATVADVTPGYYYWDGTIWVRLAAATASTDWSITGNSGLSGSTNFLGTTDNIDLAFRRNDVPSGKIQSSSTSLGVGALNILSTGADNIAIGTNALAANTTGTSNVALGRSALAANTTSSNNTAVGYNSLLVNTATNNTALGYRTMAANTSGTSNVAVGSSALAVNTTGSTNVAVGNSSLAANTTGIQNTGIGNNALLLNSTGFASTAIGFEALRANTTGNNGTAVGFEALRSNTSANNNTAIGFQTLRANTTGSENTAVGFQASSIGATGSKNTAMGFIALNNNIGSENTAFGHSSLTGINNAASRFNTAVGFQAMFAGTGNVSNVVAIGANALFQNTASNSVGIGYNALQGQIGGGTGNTGVGFSVLNNNTTGDNNTALGSEAGFAAVGSGNTLIGFRAGQFASNTTGAGTFVGFQAGLGTTGANNTVVGHSALIATGASANNVAIGNNALNVSTSTNNTAVGFSALVGNVTGTGNVAIGHQAGFAETGSNKLYITNSNTTPTTSLIYGEFAPARILRTNSTFQIGDPATTGYVFPVARGTNNQVLQTNATGVLSWVNPSALAITEVDPQVTSVTTNSVPKWNGTTLVDGVLVDDSTNIGVGMTPLAGNKLDVNGNTRTTNFQMTTGANANYILQSDAAGNASWVQSPLNTLSAIRTNISVNQTLTTAGWQLINYDAVLIDTNSEFAGNRFTATQAGIYEINAGFHTDNQSNSQFYSIGVYVNGTLYQQTSGNHTNLGPVSRNINCLVNLAVGGYVEIFAENYQAGVQIDSFSGKSYFEVKQLR